MIHMPSRTQGFITRLQRLLKVDLRYILHGGSFLMLGQILAGISGMLLTITLAHYLEQSEYGQYSYIFSIAGIVAAFTLSGIDTVVTQSVARGHDRAIIDGFKTKMSWGIPVGIISLLCGGYYYYNDNHLLGASFAVIGISTPIIYACSLYAAYFNGKKQFKRIGIDNAFKNVAISAGMIATAYFTRDALSVVIAFFLINTAISVIRYGLLASTIRDTEGPQDNSIRFGKHLSIMDAFSVIATHIDKIIIFQLLGAAPLAIYTLALAPVKQLQGISKVIRTLILPKLSNMDITEIRRTLPHKFNVFLVVSALIATLYCLAAPFIFSLLLPKYSEAVIYSQVLSLSLLFMPFMLQTQTLVTLHRKRDLYLLHVTKPLIRAVLLIVCVPTMGIWGAVTALIGFYITHYVMLCFFYNRIR